MTTNDIQGIILISIKNNKLGVIRAMNNTGHKVSTHISDADLAEKLWNVFATEGATGLKKVLDLVPPIPNKISEEEAKALVVRFRGVRPDARGGLEDWLKGIGVYFGDLIGGSAVQQGPVTSMTSESVLSPTMLGLTLVGGLSLIIIFRTVTIAVIAIAAIVVGVLLFGIFAKNIVTNQQGGNTVSHGGIGAAIIAFLKGMGG